MLLPSALTCDTSFSPKTRYQSSLFASPPLSPPAHPVSHPTITNIYSTCRALQSMLSPPPQLQLLSPPTTYAESPSSPFKLKLRQRGPSEEDVNANSSVAGRKTITKRVDTTAPRGVSKRRRVTGDDMTRESQDVEEDAEESDKEKDDEMDTTPRTPKRLRLAPEVLPLGLERSDFHSLRLQQVNSQEATADEDEVLQSVEEDSNEEWGEDDDRVLVELVLTKLKLSKSDWQDCARCLGKDRGSVGKRWKSLMSAGEVGMKGRGRRERGRIHGTWR